MKVTDVCFVKSVYHLQDLPKPALPEFAFSGRSNVGKSSLINTLLNRKGFAKTSATPGRTQSINFMEINKSFYFVDLPGYGGSATCEPYTLDQMAVLLARVSQRSVRALGLRPGLAVQAQIKAAALSA